MADSTRSCVDRAAQRRRAAALAPHYRDAEHLSIAEIARRLGRAPATMKAYLYDPSGEKAKAVKARYRGCCRNCGADTSPATASATPTCTADTAGPAPPRRSGRAHAYARRCARWAELHGAPPSSYDWSRTHAARRGAQAQRRLERGDSPAPATVNALYGTWAAARLDALPADQALA